MAKRSCIYGPDLDVHESQGKEIASVALKSMKGHGATGEADKSDGSDVSKSELDHFKPSKA